MKHLVRLEKPACFNRFKKKRNWSELSHEEKKEIWVFLEQMQGTYCAYCECKITENNRHIEHFRKKEKFPQLTFEWSNLFGSCDSNQRCGHYKDSKSVNPYDPNDLIKPDEGSIADHLSFSIDGSVSIKPGLDANQKKKICETLRVLNLADDITLKNHRKSILETVQ